MATPVFPLAGSPNSIEAIESPVPVTFRPALSRPAVNRLLKLNGVKWNRPPFSSVAIPMYPKES